MDREQKEAVWAAIIALAITSLPWIVFIVDGIFALHLKQYGMEPLTVSRLYGIFTMPFLHDDFDHLMSNTPSLFLLTFGLFLFYDRKAWSMLFNLYIISGITVWFMGREGTVHVGASGLIYAMAAFHFLSGLLRKVPRQMAFALLVAFLYGGFVWAFFPEIYKFTNISWEGHLSGLLTGIALAFHYRRFGPPMPPDPFVDEEEDADFEAERLRMEDVMRKIDEKKQSTDY